MKKLLLTFLLACAAAHAPAALAEEEIKLDHILIDRSTDVQALQHGAQIFVNYCLNCHSAVSMRYNRLHDIGLTDEQIKASLLFSGDKVGDLMTISLTKKDGKAWFGAAPPDLSVIARAKSSELGSGADWLYTYLRSFYLDPSRPTGWNNTLFPNVGMPHVLYELQGSQRAVYKEEKDEHEEGKTVRKFEGFELEKPGMLSKLQYDEAVADLVSYLVWMGEPEAAHRKQLGVLVLIFLSLLLLPCAWWLHHVYWKDIH
ncbi:MAG TPA: cytochrome c1 [Burkholderiales bacterium]|jgi:ubiquinol-cytochrome c reductase cytochrome c1 subunit|nr:cytochrome c1 [Burkholderiales bacterium]